METFQKPAEQRCQRASSFLEIRMANITQRRHSSMRRLGRFASAHWLELSVGVVLLVWLDLAARFARSVGAL